MASSFPIKTWLANIFINAWKDGNIENDLNKSQQHVMRLLVAIFLRHSKHFHLRGIFYKIPRCESTLSDQNSSDKIVEISAWCLKFCPTKYFVCRKFCPTKFCPIRYVHSIKSLDNTAMNFHLTLTFKNDHRIPG